MPPLEQQEVLEGDANANRSEKSKERLAKAHVVTSDDEKDQEEVHTVDE